MKLSLSPSRKQLIAERAWAMRQSPTWSEQILWRRLSGKQLGVAFRRQMPIGKYIADFAAPSVKLVVEVDGAYHAARSSADARWDRYLTRAGYRILRISAVLVTRQLSVALEQIRAALLQEL